ncbi:hypothetical protein [Natrinema ejinorense]|uniref:Uncharacterized protein n=1 Tax=Natrinema ejinorense TaxID=373386 RepID=A0A2A5QPI4_9EURY|nr:hypothetical protein [Natrinema ejinorense]PCR88761.1 hypothetical protein CP557_19905 [Natrinema ejinorense]
MTAVERDFSGGQWLYRRAAILLGLIGALAGLAGGTVETASVLALVGYFTGKTIHSLGWTLAGSS